jgi:muramoyltetrapeptide carboxypeptidase
MIAPPYLQKDDKIGIAAPARWMDEGGLQPALDVFKCWGLCPVVGEYVYEQNNQFAGSDQQRAMDLQWFMDDPSIKAIVCARGGYGTIRVLPFLDFSKFMTDPKWVVGYSDITVLHAFINSYLDIETIHATMPVVFPANGTSNLSLESLERALFGERMEFKTIPNALNRAGTAKAPIIGGNLSVLYSMAGTLYDIDVAGKILFIEDVDEYIYHIDRMMMNLKHSGKLKQIKGLIVGSFSGLHDNQVPFGKDAYQVIADSVGEYDFPVVFDFPAGHVDDNLAFILGREIELNVTRGFTNIRF